MDRRTGYARNDGAHLEYSVRGEGQLDVLVGESLMVSFELFDEEPHAARFQRRLTSFARLIRYNARGIGSSDPPGAELSVEHAADDLLAVLDAVGSTRVALLVMSGMAPVAITLAAAHPERVAALIFVGAYSRLIAADDYPIGYPREDIERFLLENPDPDVQWSQGDSDDVAMLARSLRDDARFREWWARATRQGASPTTARRHLEMTTYADVRHLLAQVAVPTLVLHRARDPFVPVDHGRYIAEHIAGAKFVELPGSDHLMWSGDFDPLVDEVEEFLTGTRHGSADRVLATLLISDIVGSTERASELGDTAWRAELDQHDAMVRAELVRFGGREVNTTGDGFVASFDSPTAAVHSARAIVAASDAAGLPVRIGLHTGECERRGDDIAGLTVHIAARVSAQAAPGEVLVSRTVRDLVSGSDLHFASRGEHTLKGIADPWLLYALEP